MGMRTLALLLASISMGFSLAIVITPGFCFIRKLFYVPLIRRRLLERVVQQDHIVQAYLDHYNGEHIEHGTLGRVMSNYYNAVYNYEYKGRRYRYRYTTTGAIPSELTLYFLKRPSKACLSDELGLRESPWLRCYLVISLLLTLVIFGTLIIKGR